MLDLCHSKQADGKYHDRGSNIISTCKIDKQSCASRLGLTYLGFSKHFKECKGDTISWDTGFFKFYAKTPHQRTPSDESTQIASHV